MPSELAENGDFYREESRKMAGELSEAAISAIGTSPLARDSTCRRLFHGERNGFRHEDIIGKWKDGLRSAA